MNNFTAVKVKKGDEKLKYQRQLVYKNLICCKIKNPLSPKAKRAKTM